MNFKYQNTMKKLILSLCTVALISMTSCEKKEAAKTETSPKENTVSNGDKATGEKTSTDAPKTVNGVEVPKFSNPEAQKFADEYAAYMSEMMAASKSGDTAKIQELSAKSQEWAKKQSEYAAKMTPEDAKLWTDFAMKVSQAQMPK